MATRKQKLFNTEGRKAKYVGEFSSGSTGDFLSFEWRDFKVLGRTVNAANFSHAETLALKSLLRESGSRFSESGQCDLCGAHIGNVVVFQDSENQKYIAVGLDCAGFLESNFDRTAYERKLKEREIKKARNGNFFHSRKAPQWIWDIQRPSWLRVSKFDAPGNRGRSEWYIFIYGESKDEVLHHLCELQQLKDAA